MPKIQLIALLLLALQAQTAVAVVRDWPGAACHASFADCLNVSLAGDTIMIHSNGPISDRVLIERPVSLIAAPGFQPLFTSTENHAISVYTAAAWTLTLRGLHFVNGSVYLGLYGTGAGDARFEQLSFVGNASTVQTQIGIQMQQVGAQRSRISISRSQFVIGSDNQAPMSIALFGSTNAGLTLLIDDNRFRPESVAIGPNAHRVLLAQLSGNAVFDGAFRRNQILPATLLPSRRYANGVEWNTIDNSTVNFLVQDSVFVLDAVQGAGGTALSAGGTNGGTVNVRGINNSILGAYNAWAFRANCNGRLDNTLVSGVFRLHDGQAPASAFQFRNNLIFDVAQSSSWAIPVGSLSAAPQIDAIGQPLPGSPLMDAGSAVARAESGPGNFTVPEPRDAWGLPRVEGASLDIGAFEGERVYYDGAE